MMLLVLALAPVFIILFYIYFRDKYEKEPIRLLIKSFIIGGLTVIPILFLENILTEFSPSNNVINSAAYDAFVVAAFSEELFKYIAVILLVWKSKEFNEKFDGIVYAVFVSLGFAAVENIMYVFSNGISTGLLRAITAVPAHAIFGILMGYFLGLAKLGRKDNTSYLLLAFFTPVLFHGIYDFLLMSQQPVLLVLFIPLLIFMYIIGFKRMKTHSDNSRFNPKNK